MTTIFSTKVQQAKLKKAAKSAGISLVEMVVATAVMGVLSTVGLNATLGSIAKADVSANNQKAMDAGRACAVALAEGSSFTAPTGVTVSAGGCALGATFTADATSRASAAVATLGPTGQLSLSTQSGVI